MQTVDVMSDSEFVALAGRLGALPEAPLSMPKQQLELPVRGLQGLVSRLGTPVQASGSEPGAPRGER